MGNPKDKESDSGTTEASANAESTTKDAWDACHAAQYLSRKREAREQGRWPGSCALPGITQCQLALR